MRVTGLSKDLKKSRVRHKEESGEHQTFLLQVASERLLADLQLFQEMWQQLTQGVVTDAAHDHVGILMGTLHDLLPGLVNVAEPLGFLPRTDLHQFTNQFLGRQFDDYPQ